MSDNTKQSTCPVRGLTLAGQALVNKLKEEHSLFIKETVEFFMANNIITLDDVLNLTEEALMNKILKQVHPYSVYYSESDMRWHTYLKDDTQLSGRKPIARKKKSDLEKFLLKHYQLQLNTLKTYTFEKLYVEFMKYKEATQSKSTVNAYIKAYKRFYMNDPIVKEDLSKIAVPTLRIWLQKIIDEYKLNFKSYNKFSAVFNQLYKYALQMGYLEKNPFDGINVRSLGLYNVPKKSRNEKVFTRQETKDINFVIRTIRIVRFERVYDTQDDA